MKESKGSTEWQDVEWDEIPTKCGICGKTFNARGIAFKSGFMMPVYDDSHVRLKVKGQEGGVTFYDADLCPECADEILKYFVDLENKKGE